MGAVPATVYLNGKFLAQEVTGVQRFAYGVIKALDVYIAREALPCRAVLLIPPEGEEIPGLHCIEQRHVGLSGLPLTLWEQLCLPFFSRDGVLLCLSGSAPLLAIKCIPVIHDAAVFIHPSAYSRTFVFWYRLLFFWRSLWAPFVLTVSQSSADDLRKFVRCKNFRIISNSAEHITAVESDSHILQRLALRNREYVLAVGSRNPTKNFSRLILAYALLKHQPAMPLVIAGRINPAVFGNEADAGGGSNVVWAGGVSDAELRALYENAALFVFPSIYEGFGIPPLEAMSCGCPVAASKIDAIAEICNQAVAYFDPFDVNDIAGVMGKVMREKAFREDLRQRGRIRSERFSWERSAVQLVSALREFNII